MNQVSLKTVLKEFSRLKKMRRSVLYSLIDAYAKERIDDLLKIGAADEIRDTIRALGQRTVHLYTQNAAGKTYNSLLAHLWA